MRKEKTKSGELRHQQKVYRLYQAPTKHQPASTLKFDQQIRTIHKEKEMDENQNGKTIPAICHKNAKLLLRNKVRLPARSGICGRVGTTQKRVLARNICVSMRKRKGNRFRIHQLHGNKDWSEGKETLAERSES